MSALIRVYETYPTAALPPPRKTTRWSLASRPEAFEAILAALMNPPRMTEPVLPISPLSRTDEMGDVPLDIVVKHPVLVLVSLEEIKCGFRVEILVLNDG